MPPRAARRQTGKSDPSGRTLPPLGPAPVGSPRHSSLPRSTERGEAKITWSRLTRVCRADSIVKATVCSGGALVARSVFFFFLSGAQRVYWGTGTDMTDTPFATIHMTQQIPLCRGCRSGLIPRTLLSHAHHLHFTTCQHSHDTSPAFHQPAERTTLITGTYSPYLSLKHSASRRIHRSHGALDSSLLRGLAVHGATGILRTLGRFALSHVARCTTPSCAVAGDPRMAHL